MFSIYDHYEFHMAVVVGIQFFKGSVKIRMTDHVQRRNIQLLLREQFVFVGPMRRVIGNMQQENHLNSCKISIIIIILIFLIHVNFQQSFN